VKPFDILLVVLIALSAFRGFGRGFIGMAVGLAGFFIAIAIARMAYQPFAHFLDVRFGFAKAVQGTIMHAIPAGSLLIPGISQHLASTTGSVVSAIAFLAILFGAELVLGLVGGQIAGIPNHIPVLGPINRLAGFVFGALESTVVVAALLLLIEPLAHANALGGLSHYITSAPLAHYLWVTAQRFAPLIGKLP
jgi:uncharacterized membrane protein required for colicin V production